MASVSITLPLLVLLAACGGESSGWVKTGADDAAAASAYRECRALTATATRTDVDIDQDIAATRSSDLQRSSILRERSRQASDMTRERADAILNSCMNAKGFIHGS